MAKNFTNILTFSLFLYASFFVNLSHANKTIGEKSFQTCKVCHTETAEGIEGTFPPLKNRIIEISLLPKGREYLPLVVANGLSGALEINEVPYMGVMSPHRGLLSNLEIAESLNYIAIQLSDPSLSSTFTNYTEEEVTAILEKYPEASATNLIQMRTKVFSP